MLSAEVDPGNALPSFSALILETNVFLAVYLVSHFSPFFFFLFTMTPPPKHSPEVLFSVPKRKKATMHC